MAQELKDYDIMDIEAMDDERLEKSSSGKIFVTRVYIKDEVDAVLAKKDATIAELKNEINRKEGVGQRWFERCMEARTENVRLKRALWLARAWSCGRSSEYFSGMASRCKIGQEDFYREVSERARRYMKSSYKCRAKAEEYG